MNLNPGDYYVSTDIDYHFSGEADENSMDETPYLNEYSKNILDDIVDFLNRKNNVHISIHSISKSELTYDSCVPCSFEFTIRDYIVSKGISEDRVICGQNSKSAVPIIDSLERYVLMVIEPAP